MKASKYQEVDCPTCDARVGEQCGRTRRGAPAQWERVEYHVARKRRIWARERRQAEASYPPLERNSSQEKA